MSKQPTTMDDLMSEFEFEVDKPHNPNPNPGIIIDMGEDPKPGDDNEPKPNDGDPKPNDGDPKPGDDNEPKPNDGDPKPNDGEGKTQEELEAEKAELEAAAKQASQGNNSGYKSIALKYIEKGEWSEDLVIEDEDGNETPVSELEDIDEETFFQIKEAVDAQKEEENKSKYISVEGVDERRKTLLDIVASGGDLTEIFTSAEDVENYVNPFSKFDLEDENVQARVYLNALVKYNKLDEDVAQAVVEKAKKDLTLDTKVKSFVDQYTKNFDNYVQGKKQEIEDAKKAEIKAQKDFKKALKEQYKAFEIKDTLANKLADSAINKKDGEFEIDSVYAKKMENPEEAAELILFLTDKKAYLDLKMKENNLEHHKKTRQKIKLIPRDKAKKPDIKDEPNTDNEFEFVVK